MAKLTGETLNIEEENIQKIKELFPEVDTDGKIDFDKLKQLLGDYVEDSDERYNFTWNGKGEALRISQTPSMGTLRPAPEESKNWDETENLYIEGDNLEVLKLLQKSYFNKIKMIYIDPPYNTGGDFVYEDDFKDNIQNYKKITGQVDSEGKSTTTNKEHSGRYHTDWLNMMYPRLRLAKNLLTEDGVIFISIDENEQANLKKLCDEIFGENNFITEFVWQKNFAPKNDNKYVSVSTENIFMYAKNKEKFSVGRLKREEKHNRAYNNPDQDPRGDWTSGSMLATTFSEDYVYPIKSYNNQVHYPPQGRCWRYPISTVEKLKSENKLWFGIDGEGVPRIKRYLKDMGGIVPQNILLHTDVGSGQNANKSLTDLFENQIFDFPKPIPLMERLITISNLDKKDIVLDFFAGSSTTAHAVMDLNAEDNGNRKFIMVQLPEETDKKSEAYKAGYENIAEIGKERIRRAGDKIKEELTEKYESTSEEERKDMKNPDDLDIGFKTFKLDSSNIKAWNPGEYDDVQLAIADSLTPYVEGRTEEDVVYEMILKMGLDLTYPVEEYEVNGQTIYSVGYGFLMISLADEIDLAIAEKMIEIKEEYQPEEFRVIFRDEGFRNDTDKTNIKETLRSAGLAEEAFITL